MCECVTERLSDCTLCLCVYWCVLGLVGRVLIGFAVVSAVRLIWIKTLELLPGSGVHTVRISVMYSFTHCWIHSSSHNTFKHWTNRSASLQHTESNTLTFPPTHNSLIKHSITYSCSHTYWQAQAKVPLSARLLSLSCSF